MKDAHVGHGILFPFRLLIVPSVQVEPFSKDMIMIDLLHALRQRRNITVYV